MTLFQKAEREIQPELFEDIAWQQVKDFFFLQAANLSKDWFDVS